jgi:acetyl-CoA carboxylase carboxyl transferase subunit alpha
MSVAAVVLGGVSLAGGQGGIVGPIIAVVIGEGGSGGALGIGVADRLLMFEHSVYTVASPEACASILWRDASKAPAAAEALRITAADLLQLGLVDALLKEPSGGNHWAPMQAAETLRRALLDHLADLQTRSESALLEARYAKFRRMGQVLEGAATDAVLAP